MELRLSWFLVTILGCSAITIMAGALISPALPGMEAFFAATPGSAFLVRLMLTLPAAAIAAGAFLGGLVCDKVGRKPVLVASLLLYALGGASGAFLENLALIAAGRIALGLAVAGLMTSTTALITDHYRDSQKLAALGLQGSMMGFGGVLFLVLGGLLAEFSWHAPFLVYLCSLVFVVPALLFVHDLPDRAVAAPAEGGSDGRPAGRSFVLFTSVAATLSIAFFFLSPVQLPFHLERVFSTGPTVAGLAVGLGTLVGSFTSLAYPALARRLSNRSVVYLSMVLLGLGYFLIGTAAFLPQMYVGAAITGLGSGLAMPNFNSWVSSAVPAHSRGRALGVLNSAVHIGQFLSPLLVQGLVLTSGRDRVFTVAGVLLVATNGLLLVLDRRKK